MLGPLTHGTLSQPFAVPALWTPADPTTDGGVSPHTWEVFGVENFQDEAKTIPADEIGDVIGAMVNQGSDNHDIVQATTAKKPTLQQVTINDATSYVGRFDGADDFLQGAFGGGAISQPYTIFVTGAFLATKNGRNILDSDDATNRMTLQYQTLVWRLVFGSVLDVGTSNTNPNIHTILANGASSQHWLNGVSSGTGNPGAHAPDGITVGARHDGAAAANADVGQILIYSGNLSAADKNQVGEYLERVTGIVWATIT